MTAAQVREKILEGIRELGPARLMYLSGVNYVEDVSVEEAENRIRATRSGNDSITISFDRLDSIAEALAPGTPVNMEAVWAVLSLGGWALLGH